MLAGGDANHQCAGAEIINPIDKPADLHRLDSLVGVHRQLPQDDGPAMPALDARSKPIVFDSIWRSQTDMSLGVR